MKQETVTLGHQVCFSSYMQALTIDNQSTDIFSLETFPLVLSVSTDVNDSHSAYFFLAFFYGVIVVQ